jgi:outer membrane protein OmpA-like peptidoglycan-associated protein/opacity protein-like surface antigen
MRRINLAQVVSVPVRRNRLTFAAVLFVLLLVGTSAAHAQFSDEDPETTSRFNVAGGFNYVRANAPPGSCQCFGLTGGFFAADYHINSWFGVEGEITGQHANDISLLGQDLTLLTFAAGPRVQYNLHRFVPFAKVLVGGAHGSDSFFPTGTTSSPTASTFALQAGGGVDYLITHRFGARIEAQYLKTQFPNGTNDEQNQLMAGVGLLYRFGGMGDGNGDGREKNPAPVAPPDVPNDLALSCTSNVNSIDQGDTLEVIAKSLTEPANLNVSYVWSTSVGKIVGTGDRVSLDTQGVAPGSYHVMGRASAQGTTMLSAECDIPFRIKSNAEAVRAPTEAPATGTIDPAKDKEFHENVADALFDFDSSAIRPDAQTAINHAAEYLQSHPDLVVLIGGFADDRGSAEYNLALGEERAESARKALIAAGVQPQRLQIISYGKEVQVCTAENETCRQQNRRAAFSMHP